MIRYTFALLAASSMLWQLDASPALAAGWGNLKGQFICDGKLPPPKVIPTDKEPLCSKHQVVDETAVVGKDGGVANIVIFVSSKKVKVNPDLKKDLPDTVILDNKGCRFEPHILPMEVSQTLEIHNSDPFSHNSNVSPIGQNGINPLLTEGSMATYKFTKELKSPTPVACNIHGWMKAYVVVKDHPYIAVTDKEGNFEIKDLPLGKLEFTVWHEAQGYLSAKKEWKKGKFDMTIKEGDNDLKTIKVDPKLLVPKT